MKKIAIWALLGATAASMGYYSVAYGERATHLNVVQGYAELVYRNYKDAHADAVVMQEKIRAFVKKPSQDGLDAAKNAWLKARDSYDETEAFRFYEGPIDDADGPEGRLNAWPLNEAYIDYVAGNPRAGIVNDGAAEISKASLTAKNQEKDEADVATGYHAIEFLLWGQDAGMNSAGKRPFTDYTTEENAKRRAEYLLAVTDLLVEDVAALETAWEPGKNYAKEFVAQDEKEAFGKILTALATLSGFELASERMATALDSGDQEDEHSCFSDNTHNDFIHNAKGISNVYFGRYNDFQVANIHQIIAEKDADLAVAIKSQLEETEVAIAAIPHPIDREVLAAGKESAGHEAMERAIASLQRQAELFTKAGEVLGVKVSVAE